jgi:hypothetical protein
MEEIQPASNSRSANIQLQAGWANRSWAKLLANQLNVFHNKEMLGKLGLLELPKTDADRKDMLDMTEMTVNLNLRTAALRAMSKSHQSELPPWSWFGILDANVEQARKCLQRNRSDAEMLNEVQDILANDDGHEPRSY